MSKWNVPESDLVGAMKNCLETDQRAVLATIIRVEGSAYRRAGTKMLLPDSGERIGSVTAGCLEKKLTELAQSVLDSGNARVETFDLSADDDVWGLGIGCNGVIDILLEPLSPAYKPLVDAFEADEPISLITMLNDSDEILIRGYYKPSVGLTVGKGAFSDEVCSRIIPLLEKATAQGSAETLTIDGNLVLIDGNRPPPRVVIFGHGHDAVPVVELSKKAGFHVDVVSFRSAKLRGGKFSEADAVQATNPESLLDSVQFDSNTYVVIMSHNFVDDRLVFEAVIETPVPYIGLMGPRKRFEELLSDCEGIDIVDLEDVKRIYTPIGVALGSETPYQIAHSIVAELLAVHNEQKPKHLRDWEGPIHDRTPLTAKTTSDPHE